MYKKQIERRRVACLQSRTKINVKVHLNTFCIQFVQLVHQKDADKAWIIQYQWLEETTIRSTAVCNQPTGAPCCPKREPLNWSCSSPAEITSFLKWQPPPLPETRAGLDGHRWDECRGWHWCSRGRLFAFVSQCQDVFLQVCDPLRLDRERTVEHLVAEPAAEREEECFVGALVFIIGLQYNRGCKVLRPDLHLRE